MIALTEKKQGRPQSEQHVVDGLVLADEPFKYPDKSSAGGMNKISAEQRAKRGLLPAQSNILRATVPLTEFIEGSHKY
jgi:hypothetical protein